MASARAATSLRRMNSGFYIFFALQTAVVVGLIAIMATIQFGSAPPELDD